MLMLRMLLLVLLLHDYTFVRVDIAHSLLSRVLENIVYFERADFGVEFDMIVPNLQHFEFLSGSVQNQRC